MRKPIIEVIHSGETGGVNVNIEGSTLEVMSAIAAVAISVMESCCLGGGIEGKEVAETLIHAAKLGIEKYLEAVHGGEKDGHRKENNYGKV